MNTPPIQISEEKTNELTPRKTELLRNSDTDWPDEYGKLERELSVMTSERDRIRDVKWEGILKLEQEIEKLTKERDEVVSLANACDKAVQIILADTEKERDELKAELQRYANGFLAEELVAANEANSILRKQIKELKTKVELGKGEK